jgi:hypothetical protein
MGVGAVGGWALAGASEPLDVRGFQDERFSS